MQRAVADARHGRARPRLARQGDEIFGAGRARRVPLRRLGDELAVAVAALDVGEDDAAAAGRPCGRSLLRRSTAPSSLELLQHLLQPDAVAALDAEGARDLALADLAGGVGDEGDEVFAGGKSGF